VLEAVLQRLETSRLSLREMHRADVESLHRLFSDPLLMRFWPVFTLAETEECVEENTRALGENRMNSSPSGGRAMTLDDVFALKGIQDVQISPDGSLVAFVVSNEYTEGVHKLPASSIWLVWADGSAAARQFTAGTSADTRPRWRPDGEELAFLSDRDRDGILQIYTISVDGGEARRLTQVKGGVTDLAWSPDGSRIAFVAPEAEGEEEERRHQERDDAIYVDHDYKYARLWVIEARGDERPRALTPAEYQVRGFAWFGEGWAVVTSPTPKEDDFALPWTLRQVREGQPDTTLWQGQYPLSFLSASEDGTVLAWTHSGARAGDPVDELWTLEVEGEARRVLAGFAGGLAKASVLPDGGGFLVVGITGTHHTVGRLARAGGEAVILLDDRILACERGNDEPFISTSRDGTRYACALEDGTHPADVWTGMVGETPQQVTTGNAALREVRLGASETVHWQAPDGQTIEGVLIYPSDYVEGQRYPLVVHVHGGPQWQWLERLMIGWHEWAQWLAAHGYAVLLPNPRGSVGRGLEYLWSNRQAWGVGDFPDILSGVDALIERGVADPERLGIGGWSYGGFMTAWSIGHSDRFKAAIVGAGVINLVSFQAADIPSWLPGDQLLAQPWDDPELYARCSPISYAGKMTTPTLILHGEADKRVPVGQGRELYAALRAREVATEMVVYPREEHSIIERHHQRDILERVLGWYDRWLKTES
jgi:dipeptidyl aminopeptidase/acylaminoacyl peptidase